MDGDPSSISADIDLLSVNTNGGLAGLIIALIVLVILSGCFSATETAYTSFSTVRMRRYAAKKRTARQVLKLSAS